MIIYQKNKIEFTEDGNYRPNTLIINGEIASMELFFEHYGYNWKTSANGNVLLYETNSGKLYSIPQKRLLNTFPDELRELKELSGLTQKAFADSLGIPLRTFEDWRGGKHTPSKIVQDAIKEKAKTLIK